MTAWDIRAYQPGDEAQIVELHQEVFNSSLTVDHWRWKLKGRESVIENVWLAYKEDQLVFHYGGVPIHCQIGNQVITIMSSVDAMTAPDYRRQGLLTTVGQFVFKTWQDNHIAFTLGLPNEQYGSRTQILGWRPLFDLQWFIFPLRPQLMIAHKLGLASFGKIPIFDELWKQIRHQRAKIDKDITIRYIEQAGSEFDQLWQNWCQQSLDTSISIVRDRHWVEWRYLREPSSPYQLLLAEQSGKPVGYVAFRCKLRNGLPTGYIADLFTVENNILLQQTLIHQAIDHLHYAGAAMVATLAIPDMAYANVLKRLTFFSAWGAFSVCIVPFAANLPLALIQNPRNWVISGGDFDII